jgi:hypothetical protein
MLKLSFICAFALIAGSLFAVPDPQETVTVLGRQVKAWRLSNERPELSFSNEGKAAFAKITYFDKGYGRLGVKMKNAEGNWVEAGKAVRRVMSNSSGWVTSYFALPSGTELRISRDRSPDRELYVEKVELQQEAFPDAQLQYILREDWKRPYRGATAPGINNRTLKGRVMTGYQGWFRTPNDPYDVGWVHWGDISNGRFSVDMWPDNSRYPSYTLEKAAEVKTLSGKTAYLFSSAWPEVVRTHFAWMRQSNIDGAFLQRFLTDGTYATTGRGEWVMGNVREAANKEGRIWAIEYDISGTKDSELFEKLKKDWMWLVDEFGIRKDPSYAHENGKPVVFVWGMPLPDRNISVETANKVVEFLKNDPKYGGNYVIGGLPGRWRDLDKSWERHIHSYDCVLAWMSRNYSEDLTAFSAYGLDYYPHVWPGFSWANLQHIQTGSKSQYDSRAGGEFYQNLINNAVDAGVDRLFVGMFDEYDESTAVMPMSDDPPPTPERPGAYAMFFEKPDGKGRVEKRNPEQIDLEFSLANFSVRYEGQIVPPETGEYTFTVSGAPGDSAKLEMGSEKAEIHFDGSESRGVSLKMEKGKRVIYRLDYSHREAPGRLQLLWEGPSIPKQPVPATALVDAWGRFLTNEGKPPTWWLELTSKARRQLKN